jgi:hypothetical protein
VLARRPIYRVPDAAASSQTNISLVDGNVYVPQAVAEIYILPETKKEEEKLAHFVVCWGIVITHQPQFSKAFE